MSAHDTFSNVHAQLSIESLRASEDLESYRCIRGIKTIKHLVAEEATDLVVFAMREKRVYDPLAVAPAGQIFDQLDKKHLDSEVQCYTLDRLPYGFPASLRLRYFP